VIPRLFGTNGIRGVVGDTLTADVALGVGRAVGTTLGGGEVAVVRDTRTSGPMLRDAVVSGLLASGCDVLDLGVAPTPCLQWFVAHRGGFVGGVVVTASHNPAEFNGIKVVDAMGLEIGRDREETIERVYAERSFSVAPWDRSGHVRQDPAGLGAYVAAVVDQVDVEAIRQRAFQVVLDPGNGAGCAASPRVLAALGCRVVTLNGHPDGAFPGRPPEPTRDHLVDLVRVVHETRADLGVAHDGDADRAIFVDDGGRFVDGDRSLALLARDAIRRRGGTVVTPVSTSSGVEEVVVAAGGSVHYTRVGAPIVARTMLELRATFGGEENGGVIVPEHQYARDGAMAMAKMLDLLAREGRPLSAMLVDLPRYSLHKTSVPVTAGQQARIVEAILRSLAGRDVSTIDGVKLREADGWVLMRPSGTEAVFRIFAEARTPERARALAETGARLIREASAKSEGTGTRGTPPRS